MDLGVAITFLVGMTVVASACVVIWREEQSRKWPRTLGIVRSSRVVSEQVDHGGSGGFSVRYSVRIRYRYTVNDTEYSSNSVCFSCDSRASAESVARELYVGSQVAVYYDPARPQRSVLAPGVFPEGLWVLLIIGIVLVACSIASLF
jgi:hypothetical protein